MVKNRGQYAREYCCLPGGAVKDGESPLEAALRELKEECNVEGQLIRKTSEWYGSDDITISYWVDIGEQEPRVGKDPEFENQVIVDVGWFLLSDLSERDRCFLWAAGLLGIPVFSEEALSWSNNVSYPTRRL